MSGLLRDNARPAAKVSAVIAVSAGMVASFGLPATAEPVGQPVAAPAVGGAAAPAVAAAVVAPAVGAAVSSPTFGTVGFTAVKKKVSLPSTDLLGRTVAQVRASRSHDRAPIASRSERTSTRSTATKSSSRKSSPSSSSYRAPSHGGVLAIAASLTGIYYRAGGSSPSGFDCSGFTSYVYRQIGINLPRTASGQQAATTRVSSPRPGDLVFFGFPAYHVGIYAGNGMLYDSPRTGKKTSLRGIWTSAVSYGRV